LLPPIPRPPDSKHPAGVDEAYGQGLPLETNLVRLGPHYGGMVKAPGRARATGRVAPGRPPTDPGASQVAPDRHVSAPSPLFRRFSISRQLFVRRLDLTSEHHQRDIGPGSVFLQTKAAIPVPMGLESFGLLLVEFRPVRPANPASFGPPYRSPGSRQGLVESVGVEARRHHAGMAEAVVNDSASSVKLPGRCR